MTAKVPVAVNYLLAYIFFQGYAFYGIGAILAAYSSDYLGFRDDVASAIVSYWSMTTFLCSPIGGVISDYSLGGVKTTLLSLVIWLTGNMASIFLLAPGVNYNNKLLSLTFLFLIAVGKGALTPVNSTMLGHQSMGLPKELASPLFSRFYFFLSFGSLMSKFTTPIIRSKFTYFAAFSVMGSVLAVGTVTFAVGGRYFKEIPASCKKNKHIDPSSRVLTFSDLFQIFQLRFCPSCTKQKGRVGLGAACHAPLLNKVAVITSDHGSDADSIDCSTDKPRAFIHEELQKGCLLSVPDDMDHYRNVGNYSDGEKVEERGRERIGETSGRLRVQVDCPISIPTVTPPSKINDGYELCREVYGPRLVVQARSVISVFSIFITCLPIYWALYSQTSSTWVFQAKKLDRDIGMIQLEPDQIQALGPLLDLMIIPLFNNWLYPAFARRGRPLSLLKKMTTGMFLTAAAFAATALLQYFIDEQEKRCGAVLTPTLAPSPSVFMTSAPAPNHLPVHYLNSGAPTALAPTGADSCTRINIAAQLPQYVLLATGEIFLAVNGLEFAYSQTPATMKGFMTSVWYFTVGLGNLLIAIIVVIPLGGPARRFLLFSALMVVSSFLFAYLAYRHTVPAPEDLVDMSDVNLHSPSLAGTSTASPTASKSSSSRSKGTSAKQKRIRRKQHELIKNQQRSVFNSMPLFLY